MKRRLDMRYQGQGYEIEVALPEAADAGAAVRPAASCSRRATRRPIRCASTSPIEIVNWKVEAAGPPPTSARLQPIGAAGTATRCKGARPAYVREAGQMRSGRSTIATRSRPARRSTDPRLIEERESTCVVGAGDRSTVDAHVNLVARSRRLTG